MILAKFTQLAVLYWLSQSPHVPEGHYLIGIRCVEVFAAGQSHPGQAFFEFDMAADIFLAFLKMRDGPVNRPRPSVPLQGSRQRGCVRLFALRGRPPFEGRCG